MYAESMSYEQEMTEFHLGAGFHALNRGPVDAAAVGEGLLGHVLVESSHADAVADSVAGFENPRGLIGWHLANALPTMIICQQQFCGIL